jgi:hypothetical protein
MAEDDSSSAATFVVREVTARVGLLCLRSRQPWKSARLDGLSDHLSLVSW